MDDPPPPVCEICGAGPLERVFHPVPIFFKGSGFYSTDYGRGNRRKGETAKEGDSGSTDKSEKSEKKDSSVEKKAAEA